MDARANESLGSNRGGRRLTRRPGLRAGPDTLRGTAGQQVVDLAGAPAGCVILPAVVEVEACDAPGWVTKAGGVPPCPPAGPSEDLSPAGLAGGIEPVCGVAMVSTAYAARPAKAMASAATARRTENPRRPSGATTMRIAAGPSARIAQRSAAGRRE